MHALPRTRAPGSSARWLMPVVAAALWFGVMTLAEHATDATQRSLVFLGGPLVLLCGLHGRLFEFLHSPDRIRWLPLPVVAERHWQAGVRAHLPPFVLGSVLGVLALLALDGRPTARGIGSNVGLAADFAYFSVIAGLLEPVASAAAAWLGRRFPADSRAHELQASLGGGWTTPEAVIHLYAPALALGLAVLLAMPGQLTIERWLDGHALSSTHLALLVAPLAVAGGIRSLAPRQYRAGFWESIPWLFEATRTLAGPPTPEATPAWARRIADPWTRLIIVQYWRVTPVPYLRLAVASIVAASIGLSGSVGAPAGVVALAAAGIWIVPGQILVHGGRSRARLAGALPLPAAARRGAPGWVATAMLLAPGIAPLAAFVIRFTAS